MKEKKGFFSSFLLRKFYECLRKWREIFNFIKQLLPPSSLLRHWNLQFSIFKFKFNSCVKNFHSLKKKLSFFRNLNLKSANCRHEMRITGENHDVYGCSKEEIQILRKLFTYFISSQSYETFFFIYFSSFTYIIYNGRRIEIVRTDCYWFLYLSILLNRIHDDDDDEYWIVKKWDINRNSIKLMFLFCFKFSYFCADKNNMNISTSFVILIKCL